MNLFENLNNTQKEAVMFKEGQLLILAGAGSGKTRVLTHRIANLIENGVSPYNILAITFTNKAAEEMKERVINISEFGKNVWVSTFHSTCARILRMEIHHLEYDKNFTIYDSEDSGKLIKNCIKELNFNEKQFPLRDVASTISSLKDKLISAKDYEKQVNDNFYDVQKSKIYSLYQKKLRNSNALDFDDLIFKTVELFHYFPEILKKYQEKFKYILVDEYQDTNTAQYTLVNKLSGKNGNICVVGDDDQSIYGWRGADIANILNFEKDYPNAKVIKLEQNYRSTQNILSVANHVISNNTMRKDKTLWTEALEGKKIEAYEAYSEQEEAQFVAKQIIKLTKEEYKYSDIAVLYRTNIQSRTFEEIFVNYSLPYRIFGGIRFYDRKEIKDILAYLRVIVNPKDEISFKRIINTPKRGIGDSTLAKISAYALKNDISFFDALKNISDIPDLKSKSKPVRAFYEMLQKLYAMKEILNISEFISFVLEESKYLEALIIEGEDLENSRIDNINEFIDKAAAFEEISETPTLEAFLQEVSLVADIDNYDRDSNSISLMTIHSAKGLEFPVVFVTGMEEGLFPSARVFYDESQEEEERRLCYVAITRAMKILFLTNSKSRMTRGERNFQIASRFLSEIPIQYFYDPEKEKLLKNKEILTPKNVSLDFVVGDMVKQSRYGTGKVLEIRPAGADFEITVKFENHGIKKFMAKLSKIQKA